ncbi:MAG: helix-turn-helix domain-containing protein [Anaerolineae bacterium]|nr:helix-turn-helix domain-containing protein [Anaerolineae bacterium]
MDLLLFFCQGILLFLGLYVVIIGRIQAGQRGKLVTGQRARWIGLLLMMPLPLSFCAGMVFALNNMDLMLQLADSNTVMSPEALLNVLPPETIETFAVLGLAIPLISYGLAAWLYLSAPAEPISAPVGGAYAASPFGSTHPLNEAPAPSVEFGKVLTVSEAARYLKVTEADVLDLINQGKLPASRIGSADYRIARSAIDDMLTGSL